MNTQSSTVTLKRKLSLKLLVPTTESRPSSPFSPVLLSSEYDNNQYNNSMSSKRSSGPLRDRPKLSIRSSSKVSHFSNLTPSPSPSPHGAYHNNAYGFQSKGEKITRYSTLFDGANNSNGNSSSVARTPTSRRSLKDPEENSYYGSTRLDYFSINNDSNSSSRSHRFSSVPKLRSSIEPLSSNDSGNISSRSKTPNVRHSLPNSTKSADNSVITPSKSTDSDSSPRLQKHENRGTRGLSNLGNTCFMNACIQCLSNIKAFRDFFLEGRYERDINSNSQMNGKLAIDFEGVISQLWKPISKASFENLFNGTAVSPRQFKRTIAKWAPQFTGTRQQDSQEFLRFLLDGLHEDLNRIRTKPAYEELKDIENESDRDKANRWWKNHCDRNESFITELFGGQLKSKITCLACKYVSSTFDPFLDVSLPIPRLRSMTGLTLADCFSKFVETEILEDVYCARCKCLRKVEKRLSFFRIPQVLVIQLKRFSWRNDKLLEEINAPDELKLNKYIDPQSTLSTPPLYTLSGVIKHMGGVRGGHYTASSKHADSGEWYSFNDSQVNRQPKHHCSSSDYIFFYVKKSEHLSHSKI